MAPSPPPIKTIVKEVVRPFCTALRGRVGTAVVISGQNNDILVKTFPLLNAYNKALTEGSDTDAYFAARKLDELNRQMKQNLDAIRALASPDPQPTASPQARDTRLDELRRGLSGVYQQQQRAQGALDDFVNATLYDASVEGRAALSGAEQDNSASGAAAARAGNDNGVITGWLRSRATAPVAAVSMPKLPVLLQESIVQINLAEAQLRPVVAAGVDQCFSKTP